MNCMQFLSTPFVSREFLNKFAKILFELKDSDPPRKIATLPDFRHRDDTSQVTLGLLS